MAPLMYAQFILKGLYWSNYSIMPLFMIPLQKNRLQSTVVGNKIIFITAFVMAGGLSWGLDRRPPLSVRLPIQIEATSTWSVFTLSRTWN